MKVEIDIDYDNLRANLKLSQEEDDMMIGGVPNLVYVLRLLDSTYAKARASVVSMMDTEVAEAQMCVIYLTPAELKDLNILGEKK